MSLNLAGMEQNWTTPGNGCQFMTFALQEIAAKRC